MYAPLSDRQWDQMTHIVHDLTEAYPRSKVEQRVKILDERKWAQEMYDISKNYVYNGIKSGDTPTEAYIDRGRQVVNELLAVGGYRLADYMMSLHHNGSDSVVSDLLRSTE